MTDVETEGTPLTERTRRRWPLWAGAAAVVVAAAVAMPLTLIGRSSHRIYDRDPDAYHAAVVSYLGHFGIDWTTAETVITEECAASKDEFSLFVASSADGRTLGTVRIGVKYFCPWRAAEIDKTLNSADETGRTCDIPAAARTEDQQDLAEALGCA